jgi:hypothetical protein
MRKFMTKKIGIIFAGVLATMLAAGAAFAYWTAGGEGTGSADTGTNVELTAVQTSAPAAMGPGVGPQALSGTFLNANTGPVYVTSVTATVGAITDVDGIAVLGCEADDYTIAYVGAANIAAGAMLIGAQALADDTSTWGGATIQFNNEGAENQDGCKDAQVEINYVIA